VSFFILPGSPSELFVEGIADHIGTTLRTGWRQENRKKGQVMTII